MPGTAAAMRSNAKPEEGRSWNSKEAGLFKSTRPLELMSHERKTDHIAVWPLSRGDVRGWIHAEEQGSEPLGCRATAASFAVVPPRPRLGWHSLQREVAASSPGVSKLLSPEESFHTCPAHTFRHRIPGICGRLQFFNLEGSVAFKIPASL